MFRRNVLCFSVYPQPLVLALGTTGVLLQALFEDKIIKTFAFLQCSGTSLSHHDHPKMFNMVPRRSFVRQVRMYTNSLLWCVCLYVLVIGILDCDLQLQLVLGFICIQLSHFDKNWTTPLPGKRSMKPLKFFPMLRDWDHETALKFPYVSCLKHKPGLRLRSCAKIQPAELLLCERH